MPNLPAKFVKSDVSEKKAKGMDRSLSPKDSKRGFTFRKEKRSVLSQQSVEKQQPRAATSAIVDVSFVGVCVLLLPVSLRRSSLA